MNLLQENITVSSTIINGDCLDALKNIPDNSIDLIITDPPYNLGRFMKGRGTNLKKMRENHFAYSGWDDLEFENWCSQMDALIAECSFLKKVDSSCPICKKKVDSVNKNINKKVNP